MSEKLTENESTEFSDSALPVSLPPRELSETDRWPRVGGVEVSAAHRSDAALVTASDSQDGQQDRATQGAGNCTAMSLLSEPLDRAESTVALALGIESLVGPPVRECHSHVEAVMRSQQRLRDHVSRLTEELDKMLEHVPLPLMRQQTARLDGIRKRVLSLSATLLLIQGRMDAMHQMISEREAAQASPSRAKSTSLRSTWSFLGSQSRASPKSVHVSSTASTSGSSSTPPPTPTTPPTPAALTAMLSQLRAGHPPSLPPDFPTSGPAGDPTVGQPLEGQLSDGTEHAPPDGCGSGGGRAEDTRAWSSSSTGAAGGESGVDDQKEPQGGAAKPVWEEGAERETATTKGPPDKRDERHATKWS